jgi:hypothetical protein
MAFVIEKGNIPNIPKLIIKEDKNFSGNEFIVDIR